MKYQRLDYGDGFEIWEVTNHFKKERLIHTTYGEDDYFNLDKLKSWSPYNKPGDIEDVSYMSKADVFLLIL